MQNAANHLTNTRISTKNARLLRAYILKIYRTPMAAKLNKRAVTGKRWRPKSLKAILDEWSRRNRVELMSNGHVMTGFQWFQLSEVLRRLTR